MTDDYLAGVFDGEGCITASLHKNNKLHLRCSVQMNAKAPVEEFYKRFGGSFYEREARGAWVWQLSASDAVEFLEMINAKGLVKAPIAKLALPLAKHAYEYRYNRKFFPRQQLFDAIRSEQRDVVNAICALNGARNRFVTVP